MHGPGDISQTVAWAPVNQKIEGRIPDWGGYAVRVDTPLGARRSPARERDYLHKCIRESYP